MTSFQCYVTWHSSLVPRHCPCFCPLFEVCPCGWEEKVERETREAGRALVPQANIQAGVKDVDFVPK